MMKTYGRKKGDDRTDIIVNLDEICRLCLSKEEQLLPIFNDKEPVPLPIRIMACVALEVLEEDGLPSMICHPCHYQLEKYYVFRKKCESSDHKLRTHLKLLSQNIKMEEESDNGIITENDLTSVTVVIPEGGEPDPDQEELDETENVEESEKNISLPEEEVDETQAQCTLESKITDGEDNGDQTENEMQIEDEDGPVIEVTEIDAVAAAVRATLNVGDNKQQNNTAGTSSRNTPLSSEEQEKLRLLPNEEGAATHVEVMTEDGSVLLVELTMEDQQYQTDQNMLLDENGELKILKCPNCPKSFARKAQLKRHSSVHTAQKGVSCNECEKWFPSRSALVRHERIHTGEKPFQCGVCGRSFAQKEILYRHFLVHSDSKPFECKICNKGFTQKEAWRSHLSSHSQRPTIKLHKCNLCPKIFCHASGLSRHLITHTGRSYKCADCEKSFSDKSSLRRHHKISGHQAGSN